MTGSWAFSPGYHMAGFRPFRQPAGDQSARQLVSHERGESWAGEASANFGLGRKARKVIAWAGVSPTSAGPG
jgi:hypothetical protein